MNRTVSILGGLFILSISAWAQPQFSAPVTANPKPGLPGQEITFSVSATSSDNSALTYSWAFGDGTSGSGASVTHTYAKSGIYYVYVRVSDGSGHVLDSLIEPVLESSTFLLCGYTKGKAKVYLRKGNKDTYQLSGFIQNPPAGTSPLNQTVTLNFAGREFAFAVNKHGQGKSADRKSSLTFKVPKKGGDITFQIKLSKLTTYLLLAKAGLDSKSSFAQQLTLETRLTWGGTGLTARDGSEPTEVVGQAYMNPDFKEPFDDDFPEPDLPTFDPLDLPDPYADFPLPEPPDLPDPFDDLSDLPPVDDPFPMIVSPVGEGELLQY